MPWNDIARDPHNRDHLRSPSDLTDREWALIAPMLPAAKPGGRPRTTDLRDVFTDGGYGGQKLRDMLNGCGDWTIEIIRRSDTAEGFEVLPRRWVVERTFAWLGRSRRLAKDWEKSIESSTASGYITSIKIMTRRLATFCHVS